MNVQIFGIKASSATRAAERFFKERRIELHLVDLKQKPMSPGEIGRFVQRFKLAELIDRESKGFVDAGLQYMRMSDQDWLSRIERDPSLLKLPLVRMGNSLTIGKDEDGWKEMLKSNSSTTKRK